MTLALYIAWSCTPSEAGTPALAGGDVAPGGHIVAEGEVGFAGFFPTLQAGLTVGVGDRADVSAHVVTHAGLAYSLAAGGRVRVAERWAVGLAVDESFFVVEDLGGIQSVQAPFGHRLAVTPTVGGSTTTASEVDLGWTTGLGVAVSRIQQDRPIPERAIDPALETAWLELAATWPGQRGRTSVRARAIVPLAGDFHPLGYVPWVGIGRTWGWR